MYINLKRISLFKDDFFVFRPQLGCLHSSGCLEKEPQPEDVNKPIQFTTSKAHDWQAIDTFTVPDRDRPPYQPYVITISVAIFLLYFLVLREENDLDEEMKLSLYERIPGLEEKQLIASIDHEMKQGRDVTELRRRQTELREKSTST